jgi:spore coat polysaccharide biosynthesis protein SpsF (cytidylyltransferase family)
MDMFYDEAKKEYYCLRCCYHGTEEEVLKANALVKAKYGLLDRRVDDIGLDDQPLHTHPYKKGEL